MSAAESKKYHQNCSRSGWQQGRQVFLEKNPLGMTLQEMSGGTRQIKKLRILRPMLAQAIEEGRVMPVSQRAGRTVYRLVKHLTNR